MPNPTGRPSKRTPEAIERIVLGLSEGTPLTVICKPDEMPDDETVRSWMRVDEELSRDIARARVCGFDVIANRLRDTARGRGESTGDFLRDKLIIETDLKLLAKWDPKRYGERTATEISGPEGGPLRTDARVALAPEAVQAVSDYASMLRAEMAAEKAAAES